ncbi:MAG: hypothetical protein M3Y30_02605, partial [Gemmatimonadota bacterium]|nr:hypothetical protein [Gemmatimonadota bacterium]
SADTSTMVSDLARLRALPREDSARLGQGLPVLQGLLDLSAGHAAVVVARLGPLARYGEDDGTNLDRVPAAWARWLVADCYGQLGRSDSAIAYLRLAIADTGLASGHLALRGLLLPFGRRELARDYDRAGNHVDAAMEWRALSDLFSNPDSRGQEMAGEARRALAH